MEEFIKRNTLSFQVFGVKIGIRAKKLILVEKVFPMLGKIFPDGFRSVSQTEIEYHLRIRQKKDGTLELFRKKEGRHKIGSFESEKVFFDILEGHLRLTVARYSVEKVFLHAGVIAWKGNAIIIPANSYAGKTTLVAELVKLGAVYYSDEYAILDENGAVQPFAKMLSMRGIIDADQQLDCPVEALGGIAGKESIPVGMILITRFENDEKLLTKMPLETLSPGQGLMEILPHALTLRNNPEFTLNVLNKLAGRAIILRIVRGEAVDFAEWLLNYFEPYAIKLTV